MSSDTPVETGILEPDPVSLEQRMVDLLLRMASSSNDAVQLMARTGAPV
jgi:hypothetical protein